MIEPLSSARQFYEKILSQSEPAAYLRSLVSVANPTFEGEWLEFKGGRGNDASNQKNWSDALSGFANTGGGVLIWGIETDNRSGQRADPAVGFSLIDNPGALKAKLQGWFLQA